MRIYTAQSEETLRARKLLSDWANDHFLTKAQYESLEQETVSELRTTNVFLRATLFLFTVIVVGAAAGLFFLVFLSRPSDQAAGVFLLMFAATCYAAAEFAVRQARLYRYGVEEALAVCSVGFLCVGILLALFSDRLYYSKPDALQFFVPAIGAASSLWIWRRFGLWYAFVAAMIFVIFLPGYWTSSHTAQHMIVAGFYAAGLLSVIAVRPHHHSDYLNDNYSLVESLLWLGIYLAANLKLSSLTPRLYWWVIGSTTSEFSRPFYWATWVLIWGLPVVVLARGIRQKDRFVIAVGAIVSVLTMASNKPYLGWPRHTWDIMILGILLTGTGLLIRRWLAGGPGGIRHGFTASRISGKQQKWMDTGSAVLALAAAQSTTPTPQTKAADFRFGGGASGGGGAGGDF